MANIAFTISSAPPTTMPTYDPRSGAGISFHVDSTNNHVWLGLSTVGTENWGRFSTNTTLTAGESAPIGAFTVAPPILTTSNGNPTTPPQSLPIDGRLHIHIAYKPSSQYSMFIGVGSSRWSVYNIVELI